MNIAQYCSRTIQYIVQPFNITPIESKFCGINCCILSVPSAVGAVHFRNYFNYRTAVTPLTQQNQINDMLSYTSYRIHGVHYIDEVTEVCRLTAHLRLREETERSCSQFRSSEALQDG